MTRLHHHIGIIVIGDQTGASQNERRHQGGMELQKNLGVVQLALAEQPCIAHGARDIHHIDESIAGAAMQPGDEGQAQAFELLLFDGCEVGLGLSGHDANATD